MAKLIDVCLKDERLPGDTLLLQKSPDLCPSAWMLLYLSFFFLGFQWRIQPDNFVMLYRAFSLTYQHSRVATNWNEIGQKKEHTRTNLKIVIFSTLRKSRRNYYYADGGRKHACNDACTWTVRNEKSGQKRETVHKGYKLIVKNWRNGQNME